MLKKKISHKSDKSYRELSHIADKCFDLGYQAAKADCVRIIQVFTSMNWTGESGLIRDIQRLNPEKYKV